MRHGVNAFPVFIGTNGWGGGGSHLFSFSFSFSRPDENPNSSRTRRRRAILLRLLVCYRGNVERKSFRPRVVPWKTRTKTTPITASSRVLIRDKNITVPLAPGNELFQYVFMRFNTVPSDTERRSRIYNTIHRYKCVFLQNDTSTYSTRSLDNYTDKRRMVVFLRSIRTPSETRLDDASL